MNWLIGSELDQSEALGLLLECDRLHKPFLECCVGRLHSSSIALVEIV